MSIKNLKPETTRFKGGYFEPDNVDKYVGKRPIIYRSSWEHKFMIYCDKNSKVIQWSSEPVEIPYISPIDNKLHKYNVDFWILIERGGKLKKYLVEIKPEASLKPPKPISQRASKKRVENFIYEQKQYIINSSKFKYAEQFANERNCDFVVITERQLFK